MPRKAKKPVVHQKTKNIIQNVVVKLDGEVKRKRKARKPRKKAPAKESIMINANIPPNVIYQTGSPYIPPPQILPPTPPVPPKPPTPPTPPPPIIPPQFNKPAVARFTQITQPSILEDIESYVSTPIERLSKEERTEGFITPVNSVIGVGSSEFAPTASFTSESEKIKATETPDKVYTEEPESFKSPVLGNTVFGEEIDTSPKPSNRTIEDVKKQAIQQIKESKGQTKQSKYTVYYKEKYNLTAPESIQRYNEEINRLMEEKKYSRDKATKVIKQNIEFEKRQEQESKIKQEEDKKRNELVRNVRNTRFASVPNIRTMQDIITIPSK